MDGRTHECMAEWMDGDMNGWRGLGLCYTTKLFRETCWRKFHDAIASCNMAAETRGAVARVGCCSTVRETVSGNFLKKFDKACRVTQCNFRRNLYRVAVSRKKVSLCNLGLNGYTD